MECPDKLIQYSPQSLHICPTVWHSELLVRLMTNFLVSAPNDEGKHDIHLLHHPIHLGSPVAESHGSTPQDPSLHRALVSQLYAYCTTCYKNKLNLNAPKGLAIYYNTFLLHFTCQNATPPIFQA